MNYKAILGESEVKRILDTTHQEALENGWAVTIAITDDGGHLLGLLRMDGAAPMSSHVAEEKARSAALGRKATHVFEEMINTGRHAFLSAPLKGLMTGGAPILVDDKVIGAIGVSGVTPEQDAQVANAAHGAIL
ncbi:heme-binding protein [Halomonas sp. THAF12]|uniref:GlcG/HbpS family heme-binding protein n=1 Tax=Halomonas sp. THAF12 TaxID=2587849 RepID=UPI00126833DE|nr:heme-binding protein [Halomonas sp. THAF12]